MTLGKFLICIGLVAAGIHVAPGQAAPQSAEDTAAQCAVLAATDFSNIPDALTQVTATRVVDPSVNTMGYCQVTGYVAPSVVFLLRMPLQKWNGKFIELGCFGSCGSLDHAPMCDDPLRRGYACIVTDGGHRSSGGDGKWADNNTQARLEYFVRASHVTALAGKSIVERYYHRVPAQSYFMGCSAGGHQAMIEAQRFPYDFNGIIAGDVSPTYAGYSLQFLWATRALRDPAGKALLEPSDLKLLHQGVVAKCDMNDGIKDGLIGDPRACHFDPSELLCAAGSASGCLSAQQIEAVKKIYGGPVNSRGEQIFLPGALRGSELAWSSVFGRADAMDSAADGFRYYRFEADPGSAWKADDFSFDRDYKRLGMMESLTEAVNPDLRKFKGAGGKLLSYTGWNDVNGGVLPTVDYYETVERVIGGRAATQDFYRLFVIPGMNHCGGGEGADVVDYLSDLEAWVEKGQAPDKLIGSHVRLEDLRLEDPQAEGEWERRRRLPLDPAVVAFTRPIYPFPIQSKYSGHGDPRDASSFVPVEPAYSPH